VAALDVSSANPRAQKLYEQLGFTVKKTNAADYRRAFGHIVEHRYMEKAI
jgi:ribosomal protein S18 acetylase RimI-like enzyme